MQVRDFRQVLGRYITGVVAVLVQDEAGKAYGVTANSFTSISLAPPLVLWALSRQSSLLPLFAQRKEFSITILEARQKALAQELAQTGRHEVPAPLVRKGKTGVPVLAQGLATLECAICERLNGGDHVMFLSQVQQMSQPTGAKTALAYAGGKYTELS